MISLVSNIKENRKSQKTDQLHLPREIFIISRLREHLKQGGPAPMKKITRYVAEKELLCW